MLSFFAFHFSYHGILNGNLTHVHTKPNSKKIIIYKTIFLAFRLSRSYPRIWTKISLAQLLLGFKSLPYWQHDLRHSEKLVNCLIAQLHDSRTPDKNVYRKLLCLISQPKHMLKLI